MDETTDSAITATSESTTVEFKEAFDKSSARDWCEIIKDIVAIANSDGGIIIFGVDNSGVPVGFDIKPLLSLDTATITDKIRKYTGSQFSDFKTVAFTKDKHPLFVIIINKVSIPIVFESPGTYDVGGGKQHSAFSSGTVYFRHGAKSEPGNNDDLRRAFDNKIEMVRQDFLRNVRQVVEAPLGTTFVSVLPDAQNSAATHLFRIVEDPNAPQVTMKEEDFQAIYSLDYKLLTDALHERYSDFSRNAHYHKTRKTLEENPNFCRVRYLNPNNPRSSKQSFYSPEIIKEFDKHYTMKPEAITNH